MHFVIDGSFINSAELVNCNSFYSNSFPAAENINLKTLILKKGFGFLLEKDIDTKLFMIKMIYKDMNLLSIMSENKNNIQIKMFIKKLMIKF